MNLFHEYLQKDVAPWIQNVFKTITLRVKPFKKLLENKVHLVNLQTLLAGILNNHSYTEKKKQLDILRPHLTRL